jgi:hypothetical protein
MPSVATNGNVVAPSPRVGLLARLLRGGRDAPALPVVKPVAAAAPAPVAVRPAGKAPARPSGPVEITWPSLLMRCWEAVRADCVLAVSGEGLVMGHVGSLKRREVEQVAAHLSRAFDLLDEVRLAGRVTEALCVRYAPEGRWLTAVRIAPLPDVVITIAVIGPHALVEQDRQRLRNTFLKLFEGHRAPEPSAARVAETSAAR